MRKFIILIILAAITASCEKKAGNLELVLPVVTTDTASGISAVLQRSPLHLFAQALQRSGLDTALAIQKPFTIFAPSDAAFIKAGLTAAVINAMSPDSLSRLVGYHIVRGSYALADLSLLKGNMAAPTLSKYTRFDPGNGYQIAALRLLIGRKGSLYLNGNPVKSGDTLNATNGYIYTIDTVLHPPSKTIYEIISSRPELSAFYAACRTSDSVYLSQGNYDMSFSDSALFSLVPFENVTRQAVYPLTVFAPVNSAFAASPVNTPEKLQECAAEPLPDGSGRLLLDVIIRGQAGAANIYYENIFARNGSYTGPPLCYNDFFELPDPNNDGRNITARPYTGSQWDGTLKYFYLQYLAENNGLGIKWGGNLQYGPAHVIPSGRNIIAVNGVIHEVDSVFYVTQ